MTKQAMIKPGAATVAEQPSGLLRLYPALALPHFRLLWLGTIPSMLAWMTSFVAIGYVAFTRTETATILGIVSLSTGLPMLIFPLIGGVVADRFPRRRVLLIVQGSLTAITLLLTLVTLTDRLEIWHLLLFTLVQSTLGSFNMPARHAYIAEIVGPDLLRNAVALNNAGMNACKITGPALAGAMLAIPAIGPTGVFVFMTAMYGLVVLSLLRLPDSSSKRPAGIQSGGWAQLIDGLKYVRHSPVLIALLSLALLPGFFGMSYQALMPLFAERVFATGASGLGILMAANGMGALLGSIAVGTFTNVSRPAVVQMALGLILGVTLIVFALSPSFWLAVGVLVAVGFTFAGYNVINNTLIMSSTEPSMYGRVMSMYMLTFSFVTIGALPAAWAADQIGGPLTIAGTGILVIAAIAAVLILYPPVRRIH